MTLQIQATAGPVSGAASPAMATAALPGTGGRVRAAPEDFQVDELPAYGPSGNGEHLYLRVEKQGLPTDAVVDALRRFYGVPAAAVGHAGRKDADALTRQWLSVHTPRDDVPEGLRDGRIRVLDAGRHGNKLRPGHLRGNRFLLVVREPEAPQNAAPILERLAREGMPNYFGPQRLGADNGNALTGRALLRAGRPPGRAALDRHRFALNAYQAALFNALVHRRLVKLGTLGRLLRGDLAVLHRNGAAFPVDDAGLADAQARADAGELSPSAPLFGYRVDLAGDQPGDWERDLLAAEGLTPETFRMGSKRVSPRGERRAVRVFPEGLDWMLLSTDEGPALRVAFTLPAGSFATALLRELTKVDDLALLPPPVERPQGPPAGGRP